MEKGCPLCNGIEHINAICPVCFSKVTDGGAVEEYLDPYSPYIEMTHNIEDVMDDTCLHLFYCSQCGWDKRRLIEKESYLGY